MKTYIADFVSEEEEEEPLFSFGFVGVDEFIAGVVEGVLVSASVCVFNEWPVVVSFCWSVCELIAASKDESAVLWVSSSFCSTES